MIGSFEFDLRVLVTALHLEKGDKSVIYETSRRFLF